MADTLVLGTNEVIRAGSSPVARTTSEWTTFHSKSPATRLGISHPTPSFLLFAKSPAALSLFACKRAHNASACYQLFAGASAVQVIFFINSIVMVINHEYFFPRGSMDCTD